MKNNVITIIINIITIIINITMHFINLTRKIYIGLCPARSESLYNSGAPVLANLGPCN